MSFEIVYSDNFLREIKKLFKKYKSLKNDFTVFLENLENNPLQGDELGQNCYKVRMKIASKNKGKSGGARIITYFVTEENEVFLLSIYDKSEQENISDKSIKVLIKNISDT